MDSTFSATATLLTMSKTLNSTSNPIVYRLHRQLSATLPSQCLRSQLALLQLRRLFNGEFQRSNALNSISYSSNSLRRLYSVVAPEVGTRLQCVGRSTASFASAAGGGRGGIGGDGDSGGGGGASGGGEAKSNSVVGGSEEISALSPDVIILDVGGMTCGGCAASVKRILESQPQVSSASVNLTTETAVVWPISDAKVIPNWQKHLGETLAKHLTNCGFTSNLRGQGATEGDIPS
ncbi:Polyamine N-acetyltransferase 1 [Sarracenia purpurea var. burkii]